MLERLGLFQTHAAGILLVLGGLQVGEEALLGGTALVVAILRLVHSKLKEFFVVFSAVPTILFHFFDEARQFVGIITLRVGIRKLKALLLGQFYDFGSHFARKFTALAENHTPDAVVHHRIAGLAHGFGEKIHEGNVLHVLREGSHEGRITHTGPYIGHLVEETNEQGILAERFFALGRAIVVDSGHHTREVGHHRTHHTARQTATEEQRRHQFVSAVHEVAEEVVDKFLRQLAGFHVSLHIDFGHVEACVLQHRLHRDYVGMYLTPRQRFDGGVNHVGTIAAHLQDTGHGEARTAMAVILDDNFGMLLLDHTRQFAEHGGLTHTCHILQADFGCTSSNQLVGNVGIVLGRVDGRGRDAESGLRRHTSLERIFDGGNNVAHIVQTAEDTGDIRTLSVLHFVHQAAHIGGHGEHTQGVETAVEHVGLDTCLVEGLGKGAHGLVGVFAVEQIDLLEGTTIGFYSAEAAHFDNHGSDTFELVFAGLKFARTLEHVAIDKAKLYFTLLHN